MTRLDDLDTLEFGAGIDLADVSREEIDGRTVLRLSGGTESIAITGTGHDQPGIERIRFDDGTVVDARSWDVLAREVVLAPGAGWITVGADAQRDSLVLGTNLAPDQTVAERQGADLLVGTGSDGVRFTGWFNDPVRRAVLQLKFADGTVWSAEDLTRRASVQTGGGQDDVLRADPAFPTRLFGQPNTRVDSVAQRDAAQVCLQLD